MTRDKAVDLLMLRLGKRTDTALRDLIIGEMVSVQEDILEQDPTLPWFLVSETATSYTIANEERVALPSDFLQEYEDGALYIIDSDGDEKELFREDWDAIKALKAATPTGLPEYYDIVGSYFNFRSVPDAVYALKMRYYAKAADLSGSYGDANNIENLWLQWASALLLAETGVVMASQYLQSATMQNMFMVQAQNARTRLVNKDTVMRETNKQRFMEG